MTDLQHFKVLLKKAPVKETEKSTEKSTPGAPSRPVKTGDETRIGATLLLALCALVIACLAFFGRRKTAR